MFGTSVPPVLHAFAEFLHGDAAGVSTLRPVRPDAVPLWVPAELRVFAVMPDGRFVGAVVPHPEHPAPDWAIAAYSRASGGQPLGGTVRAALPHLIDDHVPETPDEIGLSMLRVRLAVASESDLGWPDLQGLARVHVADGIDLVVPRASVDTADFSGPQGPLVPRLRLLAGAGRPGSALALARSAAFTAFRTGDDALGRELRCAMGPLYDALGRPGYAASCVIGSS